MMKGETPKLRCFITGLLLAPLLYVGTFGPACWLNARTGIGEAGIPIVYRPFMTYLRPESVSGTPRALVLWYARLGAPDGLTPTSFRGRLQWAVALTGMQDDMSRELMR